MARRVARIFLWTVLTAAMTSVSANAEEAEALLKSFEGRWTGTFTVSAGGGAQTREFPVEQQYWWRDGALKGVSVYSREDGMVTERSATRVSDGKLFTRVKRQGETQTFRGVVREGTIVWVPAQLTLSDQQQFRESVVERDGKRYLVIEGFQAPEGGGEAGKIVYEGELEYQGPVER